MKTIKDKGKVYQAGGLYEFSDDGEHWHVDTLEGIEQPTQYPYETLSGDYKLIRVCKASLGTIEEAPIELIHGECYQFTNNYGNEYKGFFSARQGVFFRTGACDAPSKCTNIKLLTVENSKCP